MSAKGTLQGIGIAPEKGAPMISVPEALAMAGQGLFGDRNFARQAGPGSDKDVTLIEAEQIARLTAARPVPVFAPGDTVRVSVKVVEGERSRLQAFEGVCIARSNKGLNSNFTVRKISYGEGVERVFPLYAPTIAEIHVVRRGDVRRAKLYYLRGRSGKSARIAEKARPFDVVEA